MGYIKSLTLTGTPQNLTVESVCDTVTVKEDESVANWPTSALIIGKGQAGTQTLTAGKSYTFASPGGIHFLPGTILGTIALPTGSTTGIQDEQ